MKTSLTFAPSKMMNDPVNGGARIEITGLSTSMYKSGINVHVRIVNGNASAEDIYPLLCEFWNSLCIGSRNFPVDIDLDILAEIKRCSDVTLAVHKAYGCISCSPCSEKMLVTKLCGKGIEREYAVAAADFVKRAGYIDEVKLALRECEKCLAKYWGYQRIIYKLKSVGYGHKAIDAAEDYLLSVDFEEMCYELLIKKYVKKANADLFFKESNIEKIYRSLHSCGYNGGEIKKALKRYKTEMDG